MKILIILGLAWAPWLFIDKRILGNDVGYGQITLSVGVWIFCMIIWIFRVWNGQINSNENVLDVVGILIENVLGFVGIVMIGLIMLSAILEGYGLPHLF